MVIAVAKWLGTLAPTILFGVMADEPFIIAIGVLCSVFDLVYIGMLWWDKKGLAAFAVDSVDGPEHTQREAPMADAH